MILFMVQHDSQKDRFPTTKDLARAIKSLPSPGPNVPPQKVEIVGGTTARRYSVTFVVRHNPALRTPTWFWGVESSARIDMEHGKPDDSDGPDSGGTGTGGTGS